MVTFCEQTSRVFTTVEICWKTVVRSHKYACQRRKTKHDPQQQQLEHLFFCFSNASKMTIKRLAQGFLSIHNDEDDEERLINHVIEDFMPPLFWI